VHDAFVRRLVEAGRSLRIGMPEDPATFLGPVIDRTARDRIRAAIEDGKEVARLALSVDCSHLGDGYFIGPTVFTEVPPESPLAQEEIFGPVLAVLRAHDYEEALRIANGTRYALTGGVYSRSPANLERAREAFEVGNLYLNRKITGAIVGRQPFGGFKLSGVGSKAGGPDYLLQFVEARTVTENTLRRGFAPEAGI
jgi:RHH-type transcriptional regulator, proline utilization regulon repressor / proline dehydrogenase / delta 1-pyrroline-5-carboxylate dehydrogenase